ncbi:BlaI/MecI/CopY family transcriptional regulator [Paenibacillus sp. GCM10027626]|uniref:BlaI/MecI/CopY family transcriptional regulator n=1 Tax=Paenibacillus sp. GCM10027626 TaxID=3273411 RepID=UPI00362A7916
MKKLPDAEFEIMKAVWSHEPPLTTNEIIAGLESGNSWKPQTVLTLLVRLTERGFLRSEKKGKERTYFPLITEEEYLQFETGNFIEKFHQNSFLSLVNTLYKGRKLDDGDLDDLMRWLKEKE